MDTLTDKPQVIVRMGDIRIEPMAVEEQYRLHYINLDISTIFVGLCLMLVPVIIFAWSDIKFLGLGWHLYFIWFTRLLFLAITIYILFTIRKNKNPTQTYKLLLIWAVFLGSFTLLINASRPEDYYYHVTFDAMVLIALGTIIANRFIFQVYAIIILTITEALTFIFFRDVSVFQIKSVLILALILANTISIYVSYNLHNFRRRVFIANLHEVNLRKHVEKIAYNDPLTGISNRRAILDEAGKEFQRAIRYKNDLVIALLDLDYFKKINDKYGHDAGDEVLIKISSIFEEIKRTTDTCGRYGGEEFILLLPETNLENAKVLLERVRKQCMQMKFSFSDTNPTITISIGYTSVVSTDENLKEVIKRADIALYKAKDSGRNKLYFLPESKFIDPDKDD